MCYFYIRGDLTCLNVRLNIRFLLRTASTLFAKGGGFIELFKVINLLEHAVGELGDEISFDDGSEDKASACHVGDPGLIPGLGRSPGEGNGNPLQYSCLENPMDRGAWWAAVHRVTKSWTRLSDFFTFFQIKLFS